MNRFPIVDLTAPRELNSKIIRDSCLDLGFFCVTNSPITESDIELARNVARDFFSLPDSKKKEYPLTFSGGELFGYASLGIILHYLKNVSCRI
jgi:isopenicillin N synthase-like dioxygenase